MTRAVARGLGLFMGSLVGLDRVAATDALSQFSAGLPLTANQQTFVALIVEQLTQRGIVEPELLFGAPLTDVAPTGPVARFREAKVTELTAVLLRIRETAEVG